MSLFTIAEARDTLDELRPDLDAFIELRALQEWIFPQRASC